MAVFASLPGGLTRILTSFFGGDVLKIGILTWPAIICVDWLLGVECDPICWRPKLRGIELGSGTGVAGWNGWEVGVGWKQIFHHEKWIYLKLKNAPIEGCPTHPFSTFSHDCGRFCVLIGKLGNPPKIVRLRLGVFGSSCLWALMFLHVSWWKNQMQGA